LIELIALLAVAAALFMGWNLGSNDAANCIGTAVGGGILTLRRALLLVGVFALIGAVIGGGQVIQTIKGEVIPETSITPLVAIIAYISAGVFVMVSTYLKIPVSTTHAIVGAMLGLGFALGVSINWGTIGKMGIVWVTTPTFAMLFGFVIYKYFKQAMRRVKSPATTNLILKIAVIVSGCYAAYGLGANNIGNVTGLIAGNITTPLIAAVIGGVAMLVGVVTWGGKVIETVGKGMTEIDPAMAFAAQLSVALIMNIFAVVGMPTSASHAVVGAVIGVGFVKGTSAVNMKLARNIFLAWILTPIVAALIAFGAFKIIGLF
jgi:PiT family inorganic phosphate transporter